MKIRIKATKTFLFCVLATLISCDYTNELDDLERIENTKNRYDRFIDVREYDSAFVEVNKLITYYSKQDVDSLKLLYMANKAELHRKFNDLDTAVILLDNMVDLTKRIGDTDEASYYYNRKAAILFEVSLYDKALKAVKESQRIDSILEIKGWRVSSNFNLEGAIYREQKEYSKAKKALRIAIEYSIQQKDAQEYFQSLFNLISTFHRSNNNDSIIIYGKQLLSNELTSSNKEFTHVTYEQIGQAYHQMGELEKAYAYADSAHDAAYGHWVDEVKKQINIYRSRDALEKEQLQNDILAEENKRQSLWTYFLIILAIGTGFISVLIYRKQSAYKKLSESKEKINAKLKESLDFNNKLIGIVAHDIRNPMANIVSIIELYKTGDIDKELLDDVLAELEEGSKKANRLLENLLRWVKSQDSEFTPKYSIVDLSALTNSVISEVQPQIRKKNINVQSFICNCNIWADKDFLSIIIRNLLTNSIKFSMPGKKIVIDSEKNGGICKIKIIDEGTGMSAEQLSKINSGKTISKTGTHSEKGTGLGIKLTKDLIETMGGTLTFESEKGKGTTAIISLLNQKPTE
jgi:signal transduction histidine kinase